MPFHSGQNKMFISAKMKLNAFHCGQNEMVISFRPKWNAIFLIVLRNMPPGPLWPLLAPYAPIPDWSTKSIQQSIPSTRGPLWYASARLVTSTSLSAPCSLGTKDPCPLERASLNLLLFLGILLFIIIFNGALLRPAIQRLSFLYLEYVDNLSMWLLSIGIDVLYLPHQKKPCPSLKNRGQYTD